MRALVRAGLLAALLFTWTWGVRAALGPHPLLVYVPLGISLIAALLALLLAQED